ncbi:hypothetical protein RCIP0023_00171 [Klebsiella phage RCIP0023]
MIINLSIMYDSFNLGKSTENIYYSGGAHLFFEDHKIPYKLIEINNTDRIQYHEDNSKVCVEINTLEELIKFMKKYNCTIELKFDYGIIHFK